MSCVYTYKGYSKPFNSELELDDALYSLADNGLDLVFSDDIGTVRQQKVHQLIMRNSDSMEEMLKQGKAKIYEPDTDFDGERYELLASESMGANKYLSTRTTGRGNPIFPLFIADNLWAEKFAQYRTGNITKDELDEIKALLGRDDVTTITDIDELNSIRAYFTEKWKEQSKFGNSMHEVLRLAFSPTKRSNTLWVAMNPKQRSEGIKKAFRASIQSSYRKGKYAELSDKQIDDLINYAETLYSDLTRRFGESAIFMPEITLGSRLSSEEIIEDPVTHKTKKYTSVNGIIDLLVIDQFGNPQIIDYKTSTKEYAGYDSAKKRTFFYQLGLYHRLIGRAGVNLQSPTRLYVAPIQMQGFQKIDDEWTYSKIKPYKTQYRSEFVSHDSVLKDITQDTITGEDSGIIQKHLDESLPLPTVHAEGPTDVLKSVKNGMQKLFNVFEFNEEIEDEQLIEFAHKRGYDKKNSKGEYTFEINYPEHKIVKSKKFTDILEAMKQNYYNQRKSIPKWTQNIASQLMDAQGNTQYHFQGVGNANLKGGEPNWLNNQLSRYVTCGWEVKENFSSFNELGIVVLYNNYTDQYNFIKIIDRPVDGLVRLNGNKYLTGRFQNDIIEDTKSKSLILESTYANLGMMEVMLAINSNPELFKGAGIGEIQVINLVENRGKTASNKELFYNFNLLNRLSGLNNNNFTFNSVQEPDKIAFKSVVEIVRDRFTEIFEIARQPTWKGWPHGIEECKTLANELSAFSNIETTRSKLMELAQKLDKEFPELLRISSGTVDDNFAPQVRLQKDILFAISEIDGYDQRQQNRDDAQWGTEVRKIIMQGHSGTELDNQGFLSNPALNRLATATTIAYQNTREQVQRVRDAFMPYVKQLKKNSGFGYFTERTIGNQASLYHDLIDWEYKDDLVFKDPKTILDADKRALLEKALYYINRNRLIAANKRSDEEYVKSILKQKYEQNPTRYLQVPLKIGTAAAQQANIGGLPGLFKAFREKLRAINPMTAAEYLKETVENFTENDYKEGEWHNRDISEQIQHNAMWHMSNGFARGESEDRLNYIAEMGREAFETNLETLVLEQEFSYSVQQNMDEIFPMIRATMLNAAYQGASENFEFAKTLEYIGKYIRNKIFNQSLIGDENKGLKIFLGKTQQWASRFALAFSPAQLYQHLDALWKDISLVYRKPDGETSFTKKNMTDAYFFVYRDIAHYGNGLSLCELINQFYGINDMDMNSYVDKIKSDQGGIYNFTQLMFRMASRPDFYSRLTLFGAQMRGDGCWDAHTVKDGKLQYTMELDKRFDLFAKLTPRQALSLTGDALTKYNQQKATYIAMADQMKLEHTRNTDGTLFDYDLSNMDAKPKALPKAYTTQQSEGMKALGDMTYGYYSHEKKSLVSSSAIGSLVMQMNTYWSSKKNQFMAPGGIRYMGRLIHYSEERKDENGNVVIGANGLAERVYYYQLVDEEGNLQKDELGNPIIVSQDQVPEGAKKIPFMQYKGQFQEGILVTLVGFGKMLYNNRGNGWAAFIDTMNYYWNNPDENLRRAYRNNIKQAWTDLLAFFLIGCMVGPALEQAAKDYYHENENDTFDEACENALFNLGANLVVTSSKDFQAFSSIFGIGLNWTPFSVRTYTRLIQNAGNVVSGDKSFYDAMVNTFAATRSVRPVFDYIGDETGWNVARNDEEE